VSGFVQRVVYVREQTILDLEHAVNEFLADGWELHGPVRTISRSGSFDVDLVQTVTRRQHARDSVEKGDGE